MSRWSGGTVVWPEAIQRVRRMHPGFIFMAEVYWDLEWTLQQPGFDFTYDKRMRGSSRRRGSISTCRRGASTPSRSSPRR